MIEDIALYISSNQWVIFLSVLIAATIALTGLWVFISRPNEITVSIHVLTLFIAAPIGVVPIVIENIGLEQLTEDSFEQSSGILINSQYISDSDHYAVKIWDSDHNEVNLVYPEVAFTFKPGANIEFTSYINYRNGDHLADTRTLRQINYTETN